MHPNMMEELICQRQRKLRTSAALYAPFRLPRRRWHRLALSCAVRPLANIDLTPPADPAMPDARPAGRGEPRHQGTAPRLG